MAIRIGVVNGNLSLPVALVVLLAVIGSRAVSAQAVAKEQVSAVAAHMHEQLSLITTVKSHIAAGMLEEARESATRLADRETIAGLPENFEPYVAQIRTHARHVIEADDLASAAGSVSRMAQTCGACHLANGVRLEFGYDRLPREDVEDIVTHMQRHQWATDRLWEGLIGPSDSAWRRGADMLIDVPLAADDVTTATGHHAEISEIASRIHSLGSTGAEAVTADKRSKLFGEALGLCARCHSLLRRGPGH